MQYIKLAIPKTPPLIWLKGLAKGNFLILKTVFRMSSCKKLLLGSFCLCLGCIVNAQVESVTQMAESLKGNVVAVRTEFSDDSEETGFGIITGEKDGKIFIVTAAHVVFDKDLADIDSTRSINVKFFNQVDWFPAAYKKHWDAEDLALLEVDKQLEIEWRKECVHFLPPVGQKVRFLGVKDSGEFEWQHPGPDGEINKVTNDFIFATILNVHRGTSGTPLIGDQGITGIVLEHDPSSQIKVLRISRIRDLISKNKYPYFNLNDELDRINCAPFKSSSLAQQLEGNMVLVSYGKYMRGCFNYERDGKCNAEEIPCREVQIDSFYIGRYEVTTDQWEAVMGSRLKGNRDNCGCCPVRNVSWDSVQIFLAKLKQLTGKNYRLPTEAEWEFAARGGNHGLEDYWYSGSNMLDEVGWYSRNTGNMSVRPVGSKKANEIGIYDMSGNVSEWVEDDWHDDYTNAPTTSVAWINTPRDTDRVVRGSRILTEETCRICTRSWEKASSSHDFVGFRLALSK